MIKHKVMLCASMFIFFVSCNLNAEPEARSIHEQAHNEVFKRQLEEHQEIIKTHEIGWREHLSNVAKSGSIKEAFTHLKRAVKSLHKSKAEERIINSFNADKNLEIAQKNLAEQRRKAFEAEMHKRVEMENKKVINQPAADKPEAYKAAAEPRLAADKPEAYKAAAEPKQAADQAKHTKKLFDAAKKGDIKGIQDALSNGADIHAKNEQGYNALHVASIRGNSDAVKHLIKAGADVNAKDGDSDDTALHLASIRGHSDIVKHLIDNGADVHATNWSNKTPLDVARRIPDNEAVKSHLKEASISKKFKDLSPEGKKKYFELIGAQGTSWHFLPRRGRDPEKLNTYLDLLNKAASSNSVASGPVEAK